MTDQHIINDIPDLIKCFIKIFADDTKALNQMSIEDSAVLQVDNLYCWTVDWGVGFNSGKCAVMHFG